MVTIDPKTFNQWLDGHVDKPTPLGELARARAESRLHYYRDCLPVLAKAMKSYKRYVARFKARHGGAA